MKPRRIRLSIESDLHDVALIGTAVQQLCKLASVSEIDAYQIQLAIIEAVNNIIKHAYENEPGNRIDVSVSLYPDRLVFELTDRGKSIPESVQPALHFDPDDLDALPENGMGLFIIHSVMDEVTRSSSNGKNTQTFVKYISPQA